jgi:hypothetical protein
MPKRPAHPPIISLPNQGGSASSWRGDHEPAECQFGAEGTLSQRGPTLKLDRRHHQPSRRPPPGGNPSHCILEWEEAAVIELFEEWGEVDPSHRKLAHRCWYLERGGSHRPQWIASWPATASRLRGSRTATLGGEAVATEGAMVTEQAVLLGRRPVRTVPSSEVRACDRRRRFTPKWMTSLLTSEHH